MTSIIRRFGYRVDIGARSELGIRRTVLQDATLISKELGVIALADGMGGTNHGDWASQTALGEIKRAMEAHTTLAIAEKYLQDPNLDARRLVLRRLERAVERAHHAVRERAKGASGTGELGTTLDVMWLLREEAFFAHVGDSRAYVIRPEAVMQLTEDHSIRLDRKGAPNPRKTRSFEWSSLSRAVGVGEHCDPDTLLIDLHRGDRLVLLSDGVWNTVGDEAELAHLASGCSAERAAEALVQHAAARSFDDRTAIVVEIQESFVRHCPRETDKESGDLAPLAQSALVAGLSWPKTLRLLSVAVHVEFEPEENLPTRVANDRVAYVLLDGLVQDRTEKCFGGGATLYAESLVGCEPQEPLYRCIAPARALRIRRDDYRELCAADPTLASELYQRLAEHLGRRLLE